MNDPNSPTAILFLKPSWRWTLTFLGAVSTLFSLGISWGAIRSGALSIIQDWWVFLTLGALLLLSLSLMYQGFRSRLVLTREGIVYYQPHFSLHVQWDEVENIVEHNGRIVILSRIPAYKGNQLFKWFLTRLGTWDRIIPVDPYVRTGTWQEGEFGYYVERYAPHVLPDQTLHP